MELTKLFCKYGWHKWKKDKWNWHQRICLDCGKKQQEFHRPNRLIESWYRWEDVDEFKNEY